MNNMVQEEHEEKDRTIGKLTDRISAKRKEFKEQIREMEEKMEHIQSICII